jgi:N-acetylmuramoyl-L-alanine amidase
LSKEIIYTLCFILTICFSPSQGLCKVYIKTTQRIIVLDPGHGGDDTGIITASGLSEKDISLRMALLVQKKLTNNYDVLCTRKADTGITYHNRIFLANNNKADLFISIHFANSALNRGFSFYFTPPNFKAKPMAGNTIQWKEQPLRNIKNSKLMATTFIKIFSKYEPPIKLELRNAPLVILEGLQLPGALIEPFPISFFPENIEKQNEILDRYSDLIANSIDQYFKIKKLASQKQK